MAQLCDVYVPVIKQVLVLKTCNFALHSFQSLTVIFQTQITSLMFSDDYYTVCPKTPFAS